MKFFYDNKIDSATLSAITEDSDFPLMNIQDAIPSKVYKTTGIEDIEIVTFDFGTAKSVNSVIIYNHTFDGTETLLKLEGSNNSAFLNSVGLGGNKCYAFTLNVADTIYERLQMLGNDYTYSLRYWRIYCQKGSATEIKQIGKVFLGVDLGSATPDWNGYSYSIVDPSVSSKSIGGQTYTEQKDQFRNFELGFSYQTNAVKEELETMFETVGTFKPVFFQVAETSPLDEMVYGKITDSQSFKVSVGSENPAWDMAIKIEELI